MQWRAIFHLGQQMARRNNLYLFVWLCALVLPLVLQTLAGQMPDVRDYLGDYYGAATLYIFFTMTYGFATIFATYYQASGYRKAGTLDLLRTAGFTPRAVLTGVFLQLQALLAPPLVAFLLAFWTYTLLQPAARGWFHGLSVWFALAVAVVLLLVEAVLCAIMLLGLFRRGEALALPSLLLVLPLNILPLALQRAPGAGLPLGLLALATLLALLLGLAWWLLAMLWPPRQR